MRKRIIRVLALVLMLSTVFATMSLPAFAAVSTSTAVAKQASCLLVQKTAKFTSLKTNKITVMNKGTVPMFVYIGNVYRATVSPNKEYTYSQYGYICKTFNIKVYAQSKSSAKQQITIKTTSGTLS